MPKQLSIAELGVLAKAVVQLPVDLEDLHYRALSVALRVLLPQRTAGRSQ